MTAFKYKKVDPSVLDHAVERRGFVSVPFDYEKPTAEKISIFYRLIPAYGSKVDDASKPVIVVINGGPGISCSAYRALNFDYQNADAPQNGPVNRFQYLLKVFNNYRGVKSKKLLLARPALRLLRLTTASDASQVCLDDRFHVIVATPCSFHHIYPCLQMKIAGHPVDGPSFLQCSIYPGFVLDQLLINSWWHKDMI